MNKGMKNSKIRKGIPSSNALFFSKKMIEKMNQGDILSLGEVMDVFFPSVYQPEYHRIATKLILLLLEKKSLHSNKEIKKFINDEKIFKEVLYSRIIDKLEMFGVIEKGRKEKVKGRPFSIKISNKFTDLMKKIGDAWYMQYGILKSTEKVKKKNIFEY